MDFKHFLLIFLAKIPKIFICVIFIRYPEGSTATEITMHSMDSTYIIEHLLKTYDDEQEILGELQMAHICFLVGHVYEAFEHWKKLVHILCSVDSGLQKHSNIFTTFLTILHYQLKEIPTDFFIDITSNNNFLQTTLQVFFENAKCSDADEKLKKFVNKFQKNLTDIYKWDFESVPDEDLPVVVEL